MAQLGRPSSMPRKALAAGSRRSDQRTEHVSIPGKVMSRLDRTLHGASEAIRSTEAIGSPFSDWRLHVAASCHRGRGRDWGGGCNWARQPGSSAMEDDWPMARRLAERKRSGLLFLDGLAHQRLAAWTRSGSLFLDGLEQQRLAGRTRSGSACLCIKLRLSERLDLHNSV